MKRHIDALVQLCQEQPFDTEKIQAYILQNNMDREAVTRAALALCDYGGFSVRNYLWMNKKWPQQEYLVTYNWEKLFDVLLDCGLNADLVICDDGKNYENILQSVHDFDDGDLNARIARNILQHHGTPNIVIDGTTLSGQIDADLIFDIELGLYPEKWMQDNAFRFWLVLVGFGGVTVDGKIPVDMCEGYNAEIFRDFEKFDYRVIYHEKREFDIEIFEKATGIIVATV